MMGSKMGWLLILLLVCLSLCDVLEARREMNLPTAVVVGTVFCDTCFQEKISNTSHFITGATVAIKCGSGRSRPSYRQEVKTDERGEFRVHLPVSVSKHVNKIEDCYVQLIKSSEPFCSVAAAAASSSLQFKSRKQGTHIFSAGFFTFKPLKQPNLCHQNPSTEHYKTSDDKKSVLHPLDYPILPPPIENPTVPNMPRVFNDLPPIPYLPGLPPLPPLPPLPSFPGFPRYPPKEGMEKGANAASKTSGKTDQNAVFQPQAFLPPIAIHKRHWKPHFVLPPHRLFKPPFIPKIFLQPPPSSSIPPPPPPPPADDSAPSPPQSTRTFHYHPSPEANNSPGIPSTPKKNSP